MFRDEIGASRFATEMWVHVARVNPEMDSIDDDDTKNTKVEIWLETGPYEAEYGQCSHDYHLDCGGGTYEEAIIALAANVCVRAVVIAGRSLHGREDYRSLCVGESATGSSKSRAG